MILGSDRCRRRPYRVECTGSLSTSEVKQHRARSVLGWGTAWEDLRVLSALFPFAPGPTLLIDSQGTRPPTAEHSATQRVTQPATQPGWQPASRPASKPASKQASPASQSGKPARPDRQTDRQTDKQAGIQNNIGQPKHPEHRENGNTELPQTWPSRIRCSPEEPKNQNTKNWKTENTRNTETPENRNPPNTTQPVTQPASQPRWQPASRPASRPIDESFMKSASERGASSTGGLQVAEQHHRGSSNLQSSNPSDSKPQP